MEVSDYTVLLFLAIGGVVILGIVLKAALKELFEDVRKVSRANQTVIRTVQNPALPPRLTPSQSSRTLPQSSRRKSAEKIVICPDCLLPIELGKLQRHRAKAA